MSQCGPYIPAEPYERFLRMDALKAIRQPAHVAVARAIRHGILRSLKDFQTDCVDCGGIAVAYDHRDYDKPLEVDPVCKRCNILRGPAKQTAAFGARFPKRLRYVA